jgi:hypothetical protein
MSKAPKRPSQRDDLRRWDDEGGAPRSRHPSHEPHLAPAHEAEPALYYFNIRTPREVIEYPEGDMYPSLQVARDDALAKARDMIAEGDQKGEDRHDWTLEIMDRANQPILTVAFSEILGPKGTG